jgi:hypothetical protein
MAPVVADLFLRGVSAIQPRPGAGGTESRRVSRSTGRTLRQAA